jgi:exosome complex exonuclease DIS3/RRP44
VLCHLAIRLQLAGRASVALHTNVFFRDRVVVEAGIVMKLRANGVVVLVPRYGLEGTVILGTARGSAEPRAVPAAPPRRTLVFDEVSQVLTDASDSALCLRVFDEVQVGAPQLLGVMLYFVCKAFLPLHSLGRLVH